MIIKKILVIPDSFKGTIPSTRACKIIKKALNDALPEIEVETFPIADGGEGTLDCFTYIKDTTYIEASVKNAIMKDIVSSYVVFDETAVIETASTAGFSLYREFSNPINTTTYGLGMLARDAISRGYKRIIIGLGGSCTNDAGAGLASALGTKFLNRNGEVFIPTGGNLAEVMDIDISETKELLKDIEIIGMCDVTNPMYGEKGAAYIFAPQKGASPENVVFLDNQLMCLAKVINKKFNMNIDKIVGGGAAGAMGAGIVAFLNGKLIRGIDVLLELIDFTSLLDSTDLVITGEGRFDNQSLDGKVVSGITAITKSKNVPTLVVTGAIGKDLPSLAPYGIINVFKTHKINFHQPYNEICLQAEQSLYKTMLDVSCYIKEL